MGIIVFLFIRSLTTKLSKEMNEYEYQKNKKRFRFFLNRLFIFIYSFHFLMLQAFLVRR